MREAEEWARTVLPGAELAWLRSRPWASVWSVDLPSQRWWLKVNSTPTAYEPRLVQLLAELRPGLVPSVRVHPDQPWSLVADAGRPVGEISQEAEPRAVLDFWATVLARYAELQQTFPADRGRATGLPEVTPDGLVAELDVLLAEPSWFEPRYAPELGPAGVEQIRGCRPALAAAAAALGDAMPPSVQHDDLHPWNVFVGSTGLDGAGAVIIDWGDASLSHPFGTLLVTLRSLADELRLPADDPALGRVRQAYLEPWRTHGESAVELDRQADLAVRTGALVRALSWRRALGSPGAGLELGMSDGVAGWLLRLAEALR